jgi:hypothetical protein
MRTEENGTGIFLQEPLMKHCYFGSNLVGMDLTLTTLGKNTVKQEMCYAAAVLHILVTGNLATSSRVSLSISFPVSSLFLLPQTQMSSPSFLQVLMNVVKCFSVLKLLPGKYDVLHVYCRTHFSA